MKSLTLALMLIASSAAAQTDTPRLVLIGTMAADHATTYAALRQGYVERNPLHGWAKNDPAKVVLSGVVLDVAGTWAWTKATKARHPRIYKVGIYAMIGWRGYLAAKNMRNVVKNTPYGKASGKLP